MCSRQVDEATGQLIISVNWWGNFSHFPPSYYNDTLDSTRLSVFSGKINSTSRDQGIEHRGLLVFATDGLGKESKAFQGRDNTVILVLAEVRANGSGSINILGFPPVVNNEYDRYLLVVSNIVIIC